MRESQVRAGRICWREKLVPRRVAEEKEMKERKAFEEWKGGWWRKDIWVVVAGCDKAPVAARGIR